MSTRSTPPPASAALAPLPPAVRADPAPGAPARPGSPSDPGRALREALQRAAAWERLHPPTVPRPVLTSSVALHSLEDREATAITDFAGSMRFVYLHVAWFALWIAVNTGLLAALGLGRVPFDPFPFGFLTLVVSLEAIFLSTFVMIAQNRQAAVADARAQADYQVNVRAEAEVTKLLHLVEALVAHHALIADGAAPFPAGGPPASGTPPTDHPPG
jgi:uncharacterized membrane protein